MRRLAVVVCVLALVLAVVASSCAAPKVSSEKEISVGNRFTLTGPIASTAVPACYGFADYMKLVNERGGIDGIKIKVLWRDTVGKIPSGIIAYRKFKEAGAVLQTELISSIAEVTVPSHIKDEIPLFYYAPGTQLTVTPRPRWVFSGGPGWETEFATFMKWVADTWTEPRPPRIAHVLPDLGSGWDANNASLRADELGVEFVGYEVFPYIGLIDTTTEMLRLAAKEPDWIYSSTCASTLVVIVKDAARLELQEKGIKFSQCWNMLDELIMGIVGEDADGWYNTTWWATLEEAESPPMKEVLETAKMYRDWGPEKAGGSYVCGWITSMVAVEALRIAIEKVGYENVTPRNVRDAMAEIKDYDTGLTAPITMSDDYPYCYRQMKVIQIQQGKRVTVGDWVKPAYLLEMD